MPVKEIHVPSIGLVSFTKRRRTRSIRVTLTPEGGVRVSLPFYVPYAQAISFVLAKRTWIQKNQRSHIILSEGDRIGKAHHLVFDPTTSRQISTRLVGNEILIHYPADLAISDTTIQVSAQKAAMRALKKESDSLLPQRLANLASIHNFHYKSVHIKRLKSRWGSCSAQGDIALNVFLIQLPWELIDYVLLHELLHTKVLRHGPPFWMAFTNYLPDVQNLRKAIRAYQPTLLPQ